MPTYVPEPYDPKTAGAVTPASDILQLHGVILHRKRSTGARVAFVVLLAALLGAGYYAWTTLHARTATAAAVTYTSTVGRFTASFPKTPDVSSLSKRIGGAYRERIEYATDVADLVGVGGVRITPALLQRAVQPAVLHGFVEGMTSRGNLVLAQQHRTTFQGHVAIQAEFWTADGSTISVLGVIYSPSQFYVLMAPSGTAFTTLQASFVARA
jgi:hypothetical protein